MPQVVSLTYKPADMERKPADRYSRVAVERVMLVIGHGIAGDSKGRPDSRQLNVMLAETVEQLRSEGFQTAPGELGEQIIIAGLPVEAAAPGVRLRLGESAVIELVFARVPCRRFARIQGLPKDAARGRIGFMARVLAGGEVAVGSPVQVEQFPADSDSTSQNTTTNV
jgi:MOSC domain-containing protein YiiM